MSLLSKHAAIKYVSRIKHDDTAIVIILAIYIIGEIMTVWEKNREPMTTPVYYVRNQGLKIFFMGCICKHSVNIEADATTLVVLGKTIVATQVNC